MAVIGKPIKTWELPAPADFPHEKDLPFEDFPAEKPAEKPEPVKVQAEEEGSK